MNKEELIKAFRADNLNEKGLKNLITWLLDGEPRMSRELKPTNELMGLGDEPRESNPKLKKCKVCGKTDYNEDCYSCVDRARG